MISRDRDRDVAPIRRERHRIVLSSLDIPGIVARIVAGISSTV